MHWKSSARRTASTEATADDEPSASAMTADGAALLALAKWADEGHYVRDFLRRYPLPQVARVVKGQYLTLGAPSLASGQLQPLLFLCSTGRRRKVAAQCVKFKEGSRKVVPVGPKLAIPENYDGWFEILSEEGRSVRCVDSVAELARRFPDSCLVREPLKAYVARGDDAETITDRVRTIGAGETLVLVSEVLGTSAAAAAAAANSGGGGKRAAGRFLRCFDARGDNVYLAFEQRAKFSVVAKEENIGGVHSIRTLLAKRLPLMVRLVSGRAPAGGKAGAAFVPEMRLLASFEEECVMALPLGGRGEAAAMVAVPTQAPLKLQGPRNADVLRRAKEHGRLGERCRLLVDDANDRIQVVDAALGRELRNDALALSRKLPCFRRAFSDPHGCKMPAAEPRHYSGGSVGAGIGGEEDNLPDKEDTRYDEIDQIYDYVRGFAPPPRLAPEPPVDAEVMAEESAAGKPDPPPIETIPVRRSLSNNAPDVVPSPAIVIPAVVRIKRAAENVYERIPRNKEADEERRQAAAGRIYARGGGGAVGVGVGKHKMYVKSAASPHRAAKSRFFRGVVVGGGGQQEASKTVRSVKSSATSPIFNIRYKSLSNLQAALRDFDTLGSSNSGGPASGGSYILEPDDDNYLMAGKKKLLPSGGRLPRPKSLSNLVWELSNPLDCNRANILNSAICRRASGRSSDKGPAAALPRTSKRIGTLYL